MLKFFNLYYKALNCTRKFVEFRKTSLSKTELFIAYSNALK